MWGNTLGWCISAVMVALTATGVTWLGRNMESISPRTSFSGEFDGRIALPVPPTVVLPAMTEPTDAGPIYRRAIDVVLADASTYGKFERSGRERDVVDVPAVRILLEASNRAKATIFADQPAEVVGFSAERPQLEALRTLGACARRAGQLMEKQRPDEALKLYEATFALGVKLYDERLCLAELDAGLTLMAEGSAMIGALARARGDTSRAEACKRFDDARATFVSEQVHPVQRVVISPDDHVIEQHAGDVFHYARHAKDRMWRVEAILKLGRYRYNAGRIGDQRNAIRVIKELTADSDPVIRAAAEAARDLTTEQYRMLR